MNDPITEAFIYRKAIARKLYERSDIQELRGLTWLKFVKVLLLLPLPVKIDQIIACDLFDLLNPSQKDALANEQK